MSPIRFGPFVRALALILAAVPGLILPAASPAWAQSKSYFQIATGTPAGTYFPIGTIIANAISRPPNAPACDQGGSCGVPGLIAVARTTQGSVENIGLIRAQDVESAFSQADVAYWAFNGEGLFAAVGAARNLRVMANLYPEAAHIVVRKEAGYRTVADLKGKRLSLGPEGSGTAADALIVLAAYRLNPTRDVRVDFLASGAAADALRRNEIDAFFAVGGAPLTAIADLARDIDIDLLPIEGEELYDIAARYPYLYPRAIAGGTYRGIAEERMTISIAAQWLVSAEIDEQLVYDILAALWHADTRRKLDEGHPTGKLIRLERAIDGLTIPLHPGAERFYREAGLIK